MRLEKFIVVSVKREKEITKFIDIGTMKPYPRKHQQIRFTYIITGDDGEIYYYSTYRKPKRIVAGQTIRAFVRTRSDNPKTYYIDYHPVYKKGFLTPHLLEKAIKDYVGRSERSIAFHQKEIERLKALNK